MCVNFSIKDVSMGWLEGKVALITGAGSGIGRAVTERFIEEGAQVGVLERFQDRIESLRGNFGDSLVAIQGDVTNANDNFRAVRETVQTFGKLDIFVGNAGVSDAGMMFSNFPEEALSDAFDEQFAVNVKGYLLGAKAALRELEKTEGCMVFTASVASFGSGGGGVLYTASKHAVLGLIRQLASELTPKIRVNGVAPGGTKTGLYGLFSMGRGEVSHQDEPGWSERVGAGMPTGVPMQAEDHVGAYVMLASKENAGSITGVVITTDYGATLRRARRP